jgi:hypothetical protein
VCLPLSNESHASIALLDPPLILRQHRHGTDTRQGSHRSQPVTFTSHRTISRPFGMS